MGMRTDRPVHTTEPASHRGTGGARGSGWGCSSGQSEEAIAGQKAVSPALPGSPGCLPRRGYRRRPWAPPRRGCSGPSGLHPRPVGSPLLVTPLEAGSAGAFAVRRCLPGPRGGWGWRRAGGQWHPAISGPTAPGACVSGGSSRTLPGPSTPSQAVCGTGRLHRTSPMILSLVPKCFFWLL